MSNRILSQRYRIIHLIGKGGMANVYLAEDLRTGHQVAVKILRPEFNQDEEFLQRFNREAQAASKVSHHNIVNLLDVGMENNMRYLVMEYVKGTNLKELIKAKGKLPVEIAVQITIRILSALQHTHRNGVIHRDIKPQNILVQTQGHIKVADFGIAKVANSATLSKGDSVMGSVHYFSPEQAAGEEVLQTGDIYSVGVVLYEMLTGKVPFEGDSPVAVAMQHLHNMPRPIQEFSPEVPPRISKVVMKAMEKEPKNRYQNAIDMAADLKIALETKSHE
ncbi:MAG: serine/threonine protein kinase, partial [Clostridiales bacterium]|nr:serine/threonine protein kinase [Clostridiales bacterium]